MDQSATGRERLPGKKRKVEQATKNPVLPDGAILDY